MKKKNLLTYIVTVKDGQDNAEYSGKFKATDAIQAMDDAIKFYTEQLDAMPGTIKVSDMRIINANENDGTKWIAVYRDGEFEIDRYEKGNETIKVVYKTEGLLTETDNVLWYNRDGIQYLDLNKAMDDEYHASNTQTLVR